MKIKENKGITLIALVITIIVLLILAGVTINMVLGDNGIIGQAQGAKTKQTEAEEAQAIKIATGEARTSEYMGTLSPEEVSTKSGGTIANATEGAVREVREIKIGGTGADKGNDYYLPIPKGMAYAFGTKEDGAVVVDGDGNEFVWVPVDEPIYDANYNPTGMFTKIGTEDSATYTGKLYDWQRWEGGTNLPDEMDADMLKEPRVQPNNETTITDNMLTEYNEMAKSVETYKGFYVGRYETSWTGNQVASVKTPSASQVMTGATDLGQSWTDIYTDTADKHEATWYGLYQKQKELYGANSSVTSGMIYGSQWDAIMKWMKDVDNPNVAEAKYIKNSTGMGHYCMEICSMCNGIGVLLDNSECPTCNGTAGVQITDIKAPIATGSNSEYKVKNIYDLAGNYCEWTQASFNDSARDICGGDYESEGFGLPASLHAYSSPTSWYDFYSSSRLQLYIK